ncbi:nicotinate (nicotinamide) nucleotide adenylyltransferase [Zobellia galactanivorans]|uniref:Probable nicotinate-nucleotide adenylyltransferase n=1 Tax=Zobellia galactanivorans (strain DSM 12802 / CCUG 47099 / CIP 106680 / NCIMB 13871 / Dsij) TaxID=63186 RepID=G0LBD5_ZOBGA|nr:MULTISPECIES: nicotinate (nicotinamide) nucleotide adenylyltransferase [Zobellia]MBU3026522.1 nicotinate-nucleotide adenylyltransferase [Zobellia galactanivorans]MDO6516334.1 nicotinate (nicotinamide) nucleotide adenylyltransferase [Zobellia uliginosa]MDO6809336.1 nicotinate (nicotinamide) nucleotide adenylyltransferase [Zobellia galactanivorans]OWW26971.1 nicotinate-nicotinamide nucleotide adenylyltransferase [Zobellia sp. OII3]CAZ95980.1 Nicotinate-nucleotide adenylyltransferase [Zobellia
MKKIGLYFGTFNPIHIGHMVIANHMVEFSDLDEVWFVVTPQSPFKTKKTLLADNHRYQMVYEATKDYPKLKPSNIEFGLPQPNYTIHTLVHLNEKYGSDHAFCLIMGEDNLKGFHKWKNYEVILSDYDVYVYPRISEGEIEHRFKGHPKIHKVDAPIMEISSTFIRKSHKEGKNIRPLLTDSVWKYMDEMNFYR